MVLSILHLDIDRSLVTVIPHTTSPRDTRFEVAITTSFLRTGVFDAQNRTTIATAKLVRKLGALNSDQLVLVEDAVRLRLGL